jgi:hypothetical protein
MTGLCWSRGFRSGRSTGTGRVLLKLHLHCPRCDPGSVVLDIGNPTSRPASAIRRRVYCVPERSGFSPATAATGNVRQVSLESTWYPIRRSGVLGRRSRFAARPLGWSDLNRLLELADGPAPRQISIPKPAVRGRMGAGFRSEIMGRSVRSCVGVDRSARSAPNENLWVQPTLRDARESDVLATGPTGQQWLLD